MKCPVPRHPCSGRRDRIECPGLAKGLSSGLARLLLRLGVVFAFARLWPSEAPARAAGILCLSFAAGCLAFAWMSGERVVSATLSRWHEGALLVWLGLMLLLWFGLRSAAYLAMAVFPDIGAPSQ